MAPFHGRVLAGLGGIVWFAISVAVSRAAEPLAVTPVCVHDADGRPDAVDVQSNYYKCRFILWEAGSADSIVYKPLGHELRSENYYGNHTTMFRDWIRLADPDPITGLTRNIGRLELDTQSHAPATYRVLRRNKDELLLEFETRSSTEGGQPWMSKMLNRRRLLLRNDTPAVRVENEVINTDSTAHSVLLDVFNGVSLGRVETYVCIPGREGKIGGIDPAEETGSGYIFASEVSGDWLGGVNEQGLGAGFSFDSADVDAMQICMYKTVGSSYHAVMRRREVPAGGSVTFRYTFMPLTKFGALDGMCNDLAGGILVGREATFKADVATAELKPGATIPIRLFLASGRDRQIKVRFHCVRQEDQQIVLDRTESASLKVAVTGTLAGEVKFPGAGLYALSVTADDGAGTLLRMEKGLDVGRTRLVFVPTPPAGEKRGRRDGGEMLGPGLPNPQFTTLDLGFVTPHLPLLCNHAQGPVRTFFLTPALQTLGHVREIAERGDFTVEYCAVGKAASPPGELNPRSLAEFRKKLHQRDAEVLVALGIDWSAGLKTRLVQEVLARVREGMGVVLMSPDPEKQPELAAALADAHAIAHDALPAMAVAGVPVRRWELGKGRVVVLQCGVRGSRDDARLALGNWSALEIDRKQVLIPETGWRGFEYAYARLAQLVRWAARRETALAITAATLADDQVSVDVNNAARPVPARLSVTVRTRRWAARATGSSDVQIPAGTNRHVLKLDVRPEGGPLALEVQLRDAAGKVLAFASAAADPPQPVAMKVLPQPACQSAETPGKFQVELSGKDQQGRLHAAVIDRFGRLVFQQDWRLKVEGKTVAEFSLEGIRPLAVYHEIVADWYPAGKPAGIAAEVSADLFLIPAKAPYADRFALGVSGAPLRDSLHIQAILSATRQLGFTLHDHCYNDPLLYATGGFKAAAIGASMHTRYARPKEKATIDSQRLVLEPPLLPGDEAVRAAKDAWQATARKGVPERHSTRGPGRRAPSVGRF